ncbi:hypothetical protein [Dactylosporangium sp. NPDC049140]|uniref:hypothetical protein n=1 Tax=Dactylosporangium sp. NPDC049140 TaxID=3155647 RepID=UPI0033DB57D0
MTTDPYPIIESRVLTKAEKTRWFSRRSRRPDEIPRPSAHESLVYRVGNDFVLDEDRMSPVDERVVNATNVSVVDMRRDALVTVTFTIPSADASFFDVYVTFTCTVNDPTMVVQGGVNAVSSLTGHLKAHHRVFELGLEYKLTDVNDVRRVVSAQIRAYLTHVPARVPGLQVRFANVEVSSPKAVIEFESKLRDSDFAHQLDIYEMEHLQLKESHTARHGAQIQRGKHSLDLELDGDSHAHGQRKTRLDIELDEDQHASALRKTRADTAQEIFLVRQRNEAARAEFEANAEMINGDPKRALLAAYAAGQLDAQGLSTGLKALDDSARDAMLQQALAKREETLALQEGDLKAEGARHSWSAAERQQSREFEQRRHDQEREERIEDRREAREDARLLQERQFDMAKHLAAQGHFNTSDLGADRLFAKVMDMPEPALAGRDARGGRAVGAGTEAEFDGDPGGVDETG